MSHRLILLAVLLFCVSAAAFSNAAATPLSGRPTDEAERLYERHGGAIYQIQVIDLASGKKTSIGSGFQINEQGWIATNYHVVADAIQNPAGVRLEYLQDDNVKGALKILIADVVHDLAIVEMDKPGRSFVALGTSKLPKGARIFALGNPHDISFTIIEGTYNGLSSEGFTDKIHFSGSLNAGMSGGPALAHDGRVVGVNVSTAGNQISFLVPVEPLRKLADDYLFLKNNGYDFVRDADRMIEAQLLDSEGSNVARLLGGKWDSLPFGALSLPGRIDPAFKCWGGAEHRAKDPYTHYNSTCSTQDRTFLDQDSATGQYFTTGTITYSYDTVAAKKELNLTRFYTLYADLYSSPYEGDYRNAGEKDATNFSCNDGFVKQAKRAWKSSFCIRQYKKYPKLFDLHQSMAMVGEGRSGLIISLVAQGVSKESALALARRFVDEIRPERRQAPCREKGSREMKAVLEIISHKFGDHVTHQIVEKFPVRIGRGYDSDVILHDPYASALHAKISRDETGFTLHDMGSANGTGFNGAHASGGAHRLRSGDSFRIGRTDIRFFLPQHAVAEPLRTERASRIAAAFTKPLYSWLLFFAAIATMALSAWLELWEDQIAMTVATTAGGTAILILFWSAGWAAAGRLVHRKGAFSGHVAIASLYVIASALVWYIQSYIDYLTSENIAAAITDNLFNFLLITPLLYGALALATDMRRERRMKAAALFAAGVIAGAIGFGIAAEKSFEQTPLYAATLEPYLTSLAPKDTPDGFMADNAKLFDAKAFREKNPDSSK